MKVGVISDVHSNSIALEQVLEELHDRGAETILCAGDIVGYGSQPNRTIRLLKITEVVSVMGNHDKGILEGTPSNFNIYAKRALDWNRRNLKKEYFEYIEKLENKIQVNLDGADIYLVHGSPQNPISGYIHSEEVDSDFLDFSLDSYPDILIMGQTHKPYIKRIDGTLILNPGSVGQPRDGDPRASCAIIDTETNKAEILRVDYDQQKMAEDVIEYLPKQLADRLLSGE